MVSTVTLAFVLTGALLLFALQDKFVKKESVNLRLISAQLEMLLQFLIAHNQDQLKDSALI